MRTSYAEQSDLKRGVSTLIQRSSRLFAAEEKSRYFVILLFLIISLPLVLPGLGGSLTFTFVVLTTLAAWLIIKWEALKRLSSRPNHRETYLGLAIIAVNFLRNFGYGGEFGLFDMLVTLVGLAIAFYGVRSMRFFLIPTAYISILIVGYWLEFAFVDLALLENWQATLMGSLMRQVGANSAVFGNTVALYGGSTVFLQIEGPCTGIKGILAFGMLSSISVLDIRAPRNKVILVVIAGFAGTFLVGLLRLSAIFLSTYYLGIDIGLAIHTYLGYTLFIVWVIVFWFFALRYLPSDRVGSKPTLQSEPSPVPGF